MPGIAPMYVRRWPRISASSRTPPTDRRTNLRPIAFAIDCPGLVRLRAGFTAAWKDRLTAQDRQGYKPHATIQNKVSADAARDARLRLDALLPITGTVVGLALWHYRGGPWEEAGRFAFDAGVA